MVMFLVMFVLMFFIATIFIMLMFFIATIFIMLMFMLMFFITALICVFVVIIMVMRMLGSFHAFNKLFKNNIITQNVNKFNNFHIGISCCRKQAFNPSVRFSADINQNVASVNSHHIGSCRLIAVHVNAVINKHMYIVIFRIISKQIHCPVINWENSSNDFNFVFSICCVRVISTSRKQRKTKCNAK